MFLDVCKKGFILLTLSIWNSFTICMGSSAEAKMGTKISSLRTHQWSTCVCGITGGSRAPHLELGQR
ncbi:hypothetical protein XELAEV_18032572mg [Xenopus laevis]|uniref:Uncharacterized protein n=1 Tax=Xenopus laevis TaxID=8355 RepID=A0A974HH60_XENLA|nr:hypothetical protein XELAEV_18032572mg [Xenopus laevis]